MEDLILISLALIVITAIYPTKKPNTTEKVAIVLGDKSGKKNAITVGVNDSKLKLDKPLTQVKIEGNGSLSKPTKISPKELNDKFSGAIDAIPKKMFSTNIFFKSGIKLHDDYLMRIFQIKNEIKRRQPCEVDIAGYSDTKGSRDKNLIISKKRAELIKTLLEVTKVEIKNINIKAYGESRQLIKTKDNISEPKNRRVEVIVK